MTSALAEPSALKGKQQPRVYCAPEYVSTTGDEALELCAMAGLYLDPWQEFVLRHSLGERADGKWSAFEVAMVVPRQNGKGAVLEARELVGLFLLGERLIIHSAHEFATSSEHFRRLEELISNTPALHKRVKPRGYKHSHGEEGIELRSGQRIRFRTRTKGGGRGFTGDLVIFDEAMELADSFHGALLPTLSARSILGNPQVWYAASAVDQLVHENGIVLARLRERGHKGDDPALAYFEWSANFPTPDEVNAPTDERHWAEANPGLGIRISAEHIGREQRSLDERRFAVERLCVGDWPRTDGLGEVVIDLEVWGQLIDRQSKIAGDLVLAFDVNPERTRSSISAAGRRADNLLHVEVLERRPGTGWVPGRLAELVEKHKPAGVLCDAVGPAASLIRELEPLGVEVKPLQSNAHAQACGLFVDVVSRKTLKHLGQTELLSAIKSAARRPLVDAFAWSRRNSHADITPLVSSTLAIYGAHEFSPSYRFVGF